MAPGQDWCLQCGAGAPDSLGSAGWRSGAAVLAAVVALLLGAAGAGYAALSKGARKAPVVVQTVASTPPATSTPAPATPLPPTASAPAPLPPITAKPPTIPLTASTPKTPTATAPAGTNQGASGGTPSTGASGEGATKAILLDTNAASTYNPYSYPAANFGDPALAIDGDASTGWTARVEAASAPRLAEGVLIDLKSARKLAALAFLTTTPGMTVQVYGSKAKTAPTSITDPAWVPLSHATHQNKRKLRLKLREADKAFRFITLWISKAPPSSTPEQPGRVTVNELELFPAQG